MAWINNKTRKIYYAGSITIIHNGVLFSGIPSVEQLIKWGFEEYIPPVVEVIEESIDNDINEQEGNEPIVDEPVVDDEYTVNDENTTDAEPTTDDETPEETE